MRLQSSIYLNTNSTKNIQPTLLKQMHNASFCKTQTNLCVEIDLAIHQSIEYSNRNKIQVCMDVHKSCTETELESV